MIEGLRKMEEEGEDEVDLTRPRSGGWEPKEEFPRPLSQVSPTTPLHPLHPPSTPHLLFRVGLCLPLPPVSPTWTSLSGSWRRWRVSWTMTWRRAGQLTMVDQEVLFVEEPGSGTCRLALQGLATKASRRWPRYSNSCLVNPTGPSAGFQRHIRYEHYQIGPRKR